MNADQEQRQNRPASQQQRSRLVMWQQYSRDQEHYLRNELKGDVKYPVLQHSHVLGLPLRSPGYKTCIYCTGDSDNAYRQRRQRKYIRHGALSAADTNSTTLKCTIVGVPNASIVVLLVLPRVSVINVITTNCSPVSPRQQIRLLRRNFPNQ